MEDIKNEEVGEAQEAPQEEQEAPTQQASTSFTREDVMQIIDVKLGDFLSRFTNAENGKEVEEEQEQEQEQEQGVDF